MTWYTMGTDGNIYEMILPYPSLSCFLVAAHVLKFHFSAIVAISFQFDFYKLLQKEVFNELCL